ncbi:MAG: hypothetical protein AAF967_12760 [Pseudomonadota bacterium]
MHQVTLSVPELAAILDAFRSCRDRHPVRDRRFSLAVAGAAASPGLTLRKKVVQAVASPCDAEDVPVDGLNANAVLIFFKFHPLGDDLGRPSHSKAVADMLRQPGGALDLAAAQLPYPSSTICSLGPIVIQIRIAPDLTVDRTSVSSKTSRDLALAQAH